MHGDISRTTEPILGLFVLIWMHFSCSIKIGQWKFEFLKIFEKGEQFEPVVCTRNHQGRIQVWADFGPSPSFWQLNHANSACFEAISANFNPNFDTRPPLFTNPGPGPDPMESILESIVIVWKCYHIHRVRDFHHKHKLYFYFECKVLKDMILNFNHTFLFQKWSETSWALYSAIWPYQGKNWSQNQSDRVQFLWWQIFSYGKSWLTSPK